MNTKKHIIETALMLFMTNGYENTSLSDIAGILNITKPALYYHFKNKDELFLAAAYQFLSELESMLDTLTSNQFSLKETMAMLFNSLHEMVGYYKKYVNIDNHSIMVRAYFFLYDAIKRDLGFRERLKEIYGKSINALFEKFNDTKEASILRDDLDYETLSFHIVALVEGTYLMTIVDPEIDLADLGNKLFNNFWKMLTKQ